MSKVLPVGLCFLGSSRARAYVDEFQRLGVMPAEVIVLGDRGVEDGLAEEAARHGYASLFHDVALDEEAVFKSWGVPVVRLACTDMNSPEVHEALRSCVSNYFVFTGGGILTRETLGLGKQFIHMHPGLTPEYRGSTCFYYSLLEGFTLGATGFVMAEKLDAGPVLASVVFGLNYRIGPDQELFMDHVLDAHIRAVTLGRILEMIMAGDGLDGVSQQPVDRQAYFVMHPVLRGLAVREVNNTFDAEAPQGIFEI